MVSLMYSVATYVSNSVLNYNLDYNQVCCVASLGFCYKTLVRFYTETCWVHCNTKSLTHQGCSRWFVLASSVEPVTLHANFVSTQVYFRTK